MKDGDLPPDLQYFCYNDLCHQTQIPEDFSYVMIFAICPYLICLQVLCVILARLRAIYSSWLNPIRQLNFKHCVSMLK